VVSFCVELHSTCCGTYPVHPLLGLVSYYAAIERNRSSQGAADAAYSQEFFCVLWKAAMDEWIRQAEVWVGQAEGWIRQQPPEQIYVAAAVVAVTILVLIVGTVPNLEVLLPCIECPWSLGMVVLRTST